MSHEDLENAVVNDNINNEAELITNLFGLTIDTDEWGTRPGHGRRYVIPVGEINAFVFERLGNTLGEQFNWDPPEIDLHFPRNFETPFSENINSFIGSLVGGQALCPDRLNRVATWCKAYIDGWAVIESTGQFRALHEVRDHTHLRYGLLCKIILEVNSFMIEYKAPSKSTIVAYQQWLLSVLSDNEDLTAILIDMIPGRIANDELYQLTTANLLKWVSTVPWAQLMTHWAAGITVVDLITLMVNINATQVGCECKAEDGAGNTYFIPSLKTLIPLEVGYYALDRDFDYFTQLAFLRFIDCLDVGNTIND